MQSLQTWQMYEGEKSSGRDQTLIVCCELEKRPAVIRFLLYISQSCPCVHGCQHVHWHSKTCSSCWVLAAKRSDAANTHTHSPHQAQIIHIFYAQTDLKTSAWFHLCSFKAYPTTAWQIMMQSVTNDVWKSHPNSPYSCTLYLEHEQMNRQTKLLPHCIILRKIKCVIFQSFINIKT